MKHRCVYMYCYTGKGVQIYKSGARYDGDWKEGMRHGFGTYSVKNSRGDLVKQYAGGWKNDKKHVRVMQLATQDASPAC